MLPSGNRRATGDVTLPAYGGRTEPGTLLKHHVPLKTDPWNVATPGFTEIDLVAHSGSLGDGEFLHSLNLTDIHTTWVETAAVLGKGQAAVQAASRSSGKRCPSGCAGSTRTTARNSSITTSGTIALPSRAPVKLPC